MSDFEVNIVDEVTPELVEATERLMPQLGSGNQVSLTYDYLQRIVDNTANTWFIARSPEEHGKIVGMAVLVVFELPTNIRALLENVVVDDRFQHQGIGSALVESAKEEADRVLVNTVRASASVSNTASNAMLLKAGSVIESDLNHYEIDIQQGPRL